MIGLYILVIVSLFFAVRGIVVRSKIFELPTIYGLLTLAFIIPQALAVERSPFSTLDTWYAWLYMTLCIVMAALGFDFAKKTNVRSIGTESVWDTVRERRYLLGAMALMLLGLFSSFQVRSIAAESELGTRWTGVVTFWYLLMQAIFYALAMAVLRYQKTRRAAYFVIALITIAAILLMVGQNVKRHMIAELAIIISASVFFVRGRLPSRSIIILACVAGTLLLHQVGALRAYINDGHGNLYQAITDGVLFENFEYFNADRGPEVTSAVVDIYVASETGHLEGPFPLWNRLVHQYVPAFILGRDFKESLKVDPPAQSIYETKLVSFISPGATRTGFSDTYRGYSVFGCLVFMVIGLLMGHLYKQALSGSFWAQFYYIVLVNDSLIAITESTSRFFSTLPFLILITWIFIRPGPRNNRRIDQVPPIIRKLKIQQDYRLYRTGDNT